MNPGLYAKAITAGVVSLILGWVAVIGVEIDPTREEFLSTLVLAVVTSALTWAIPNTPKDD